MKTLLVLLVLGAAAYFGWKHFSPATVGTDGSSGVQARVAVAAEKARAAAAATFAAEGSPDSGPVEAPASAPRAPAETVAELGAKAKALTRDLGEKGERLLEKAKLASERVDDTRIVAMIAGKLLLEKELPSRAITVECRDGVVLLTGSAPTETVRARVVKLAKETSGVVSVESRIVVN
jgi:hyperosmotically inducible periplasmic protein